jgi:prepilin-type N-terminal cleavage/methylation domain-containing protein
MTKKLMKNNGFTLIELIVTIVVVSILTTIGFISLRSSSRTQALNKIEREIKVGLEKAKNDAFYSKKPLSGCEIFAGNEFYLDIGNSLYTISAICQTEAGGESLIEMDRQSLNSEIVLDLSPFSIQYFSLDGGTNLAGNMIITMTLMSEVRTITVLTSGEIVIGTI